MRTRQFLSMGSAALLAGGVFALATPAQAADNNATVSILHGVPGATVDVYANGKALLKNFKPGTLTDPQQLPAGTYDLKVVKAGDGADGDAVIEADNVKVPGGANITVAAHLSEDGDPTLTPFVNDVSKVAAGQGRLVVRHTAAAPAVDVLAGGQPVFEDLANAKEAKADLAAGTVSASVALAGTTDPVIGPADVPVKEGSATIVYAWGSAEDENLAVAVQTIDGLHSTPSGVPSGTADVGSDALPVALGGIALLGALVAAGSASRARRVRA